MALFVPSVPACVCTRPRIVKGVVCTEASEIWRGYHDYIRDHWNVLDVLSIILSSSGFIVRCVDQDEAWGRYLYALSAPLVFTRILFFAQILPDQGPMVQERLSHGLLHGMWRLGKVSSTLISSVDLGADVSASGMQSVPHHKYVAADLMYVRALFVL